MIPRRITIHCSDSPNGKPYDIEKIRIDHEKRGFSDVGYHAVIQPDGLVQPGRPTIEVGAHVEGHNTGNLGVCMVGDTRFSQAQFDSLKKLIRSWWFEFPHIEEWEIYGHYEWDSAKKQGKTCPNMNAKRLLTWILVGGRESIEEYLIEEHGP